MVPNTDSCLPEGVDLVEILKDSVQEVFTMMVSNFHETAVVSPETENEVQVRDDSGKPERVSLDTEASVEFHGEINGCVALRCSAAGAMDIARGFLMTDDGETLEVEEVTDALAECANMVTGVLKTKGLDPHGEFEMGLPQVSQPTADHSGEHRGILAYRLAEGLISVEIWIED